MFDRIRPGTANTPSHLNLLIVLQCGPNMTLNPSFHCLLFTHNIAMANEGRVRCLEANGIKLVQNFTRPKSRIE
jgi:hypothetical protein